jgi:heat shock protein HtpX
MKRVFLLVLTNLAILLVISVVAQITGLDAWLARQGDSLEGLLVVAAVFGFGGSLISLLISKWMAVRTMGIQVIQQPTNANQQWLIETVSRLASQAGVGRPDVGVFDSPQPNAFATGASRDHALVAVSNGLFSTMNKDQIEAVIGHELTHVANGDMVTLTLIQGVLNTFVFALSRIVGSIVDRSTSRDGEGSGAAYFVTVIVTQLVLGILATIIVMWFSRWREFRADAGGARLAGRQRMISALERLRDAHDDPLPSHMSAFGISGGEGNGLTRLFMSHPPLEARIAALRAGADA